MFLLFLVRSTLLLFAFGVTWPLCFLRPVLGYSENFTILDKGKIGNNKWLRYYLFTKIVSHIKSLMRKIMPLSHAWLSKSFL